MSLSTRIALTLSLVLLVGAVIGGVTYQRVFRAYFGGVERTVALESADKVRNALDEELSDLSRDGARIALSDVLYAAMTTRSQRAQLGELLQPEVLRETGLDVVFVTDVEGRVYKSHVQHPDRPPGTKLRAFPRESINLQQLVGAALVVASEGGSVKDERGVLKQGIFMTELGPLLLAARNLVPASREAPRRGIVLVGRFLGETLDAELERRLGFAVDVWPVGAKSIPSEIEAIQDQVTSSPVPVLRYVDEETLDVLATVDDIQKRPEFLVRATLARDLAAAGAVAGRSGVLMSVTLCMVLLFALMASLRHLILKPLQTLTDAVVHTGEREDYSVRVGGEREDEIGMLGREFDRMLERLEEARRQVIGTARSAGMSEIAQEILHSAGTVLNSVNTSAGMLKERLHNMQVQDLAQICDMLEQHKDDLASFVTSDPRGQHLEPFLHALSDRMTDEHVAMTDELAQLCEGIERVCSLVRSQEDNAGEARLLERVTAQRIFDDVVTVASKLADAGGLHFSVEIEEDLPMIVTDRHMVAEILVHLVQNAWESIERFGSRVGGHRMALRASLELGARVRFEVTDSGEGIAAEDHDQLFEFGYTTQEGGSGLGLHASANSANILGGKIEISSRGIGEGATVSLVLPIDVAQMEEAEARGALGSAA